MGLLSKALSAAKGATTGLAAQTTSDSAAIGEKMKMVRSVDGSAAPAAPAAKPYVASPADRVKPGAKYGDRPGEQRIDVKQMLGSYKKGGKVKKTGIYKLHAKERVLNAKQTKQIEKTGMVKGLSK